MINMEQKKVLYIAHSGIKGQKWGVRRYQNPDGTLTEEGKKRYGYQSKKNQALYTAGKVSMGAAFATGATALGFASTAVAPMSVIAGLVGGAAVLSMSAAAAVGSAMRNSSKIREHVYKAFGSMDPSTAYRLSRYFGALGSKKADRLSGYDEVRTGTIK